MKLKWLCMCVCKCEPVSMHIESCLCQYVSFHTGLLHSSGSRAVAVAGPLSCTYLSSEFPVLYCRFHTFITDMYFASLLLAMCMSFCIWKFVCNPAHMQMDKPANWDRYILSFIHWKTFAISVELPLHCLVNLLQLQVYVKYWVFAV